MQYIIFTYMRHMRAHHFICIHHYISIYVTLFDVISYYIYIYIIKGSWEAISELRMTFYLVQLTMMKGGRSCNNT